MSRKRGNDNSGDEELESWGRAVLRLMHRKEKLEERGWRSASGTRPGGGGDTTRRATFRRTISEAI